MRVNNWYTQGDSYDKSPAYRDGQQRLWKNPRQKHSHFVFSHEKSGNVFRGYLDWNDGWYWEDLHGHRVGPFETRDLCLEAFVCFATGA